MENIEGTQTFTNRREKAWNMIGNKSLIGRIKMTKLKIYIPSHRRCPVIYVRTYKHTTYGRPVF